MILILHQRRDFIEKGTAVKQAQDDAAHRLSVQ